MLVEPGSRAVVVLHGPPGVGKSELAREYARAHKNDYPGGAFFLQAEPETLAAQLARIGKVELNLDPEDFGLDDQALRTLRELDTAPALLILDNAVSADALQAWLPVLGSARHTIITSVRNIWDGGWPQLPVPRLDSDTALEIVEKLAGPAIAAEYGERMVEVSEGLPVQLVPWCRTVAREVRLGHAVKAVLATETLESFDSVYEPLPSASRLLLHSAAHLNPQRIIRDELKGHMVEGAGWSDEQFDQALEACLDVHLLDGKNELRMHQLFSTFLKETGVTTDLAASAGSVDQARASRFSLLAGQVAAAPHQSEQVGLLLGYPTRPEDWRADLIAMAASEAIGIALHRIGQFEAARPWFERAVSEWEIGDIDGRVDHEGLGSSLHGVGECLDSLGQFEAARSWYERAVSEKEKGDINGYVNRGSLSTSIHQVGYCFANQGRYDAALPWFERAVSELEARDVDDCIDHESFSASLHQVGNCLADQGKHEAARLWFERAVSEAEKGDAHGRVDHQSLGVSLHQVGRCFFRQAQFEAARQWFERAVKEAEKGDIHGRIDHGSLSVSVHAVGTCFSRQGLFEAARPWFERAVKEAEKGDIHGRVNHESLGANVHEVGACFARQGQFEAARPWFERAVKEAEKGDIHGRIDHESLSMSLRMVGSCLFRQDDYEAAYPWYERAVSEAEKGDIHGRINHEGLGALLREGTRCLRALGRVEDADTWERRAVKMPG